MAKRSTRLIPLLPYLLAGHGAFLAILIIIPLNLFVPFWGVMFGPEWRAAIPDWASFHGQESVLIAIFAATYPVCVGGALVLWMIHERKAQRYLQQCRG